MTTQSEKKDYVKPIPGASEETLPYWKALTEHKLMLPKCPECGRISFPPRAMCPKCLNFDQVWTELSGKATVHTFSVVYQNGAPGFRDEVPYVVGYVTLDEGPQMMTNVIGIDPKDVKIGQKVEIVYEDIMDDLTIPKFKPTGS